jgi:hypothetical protein
MRDPIGFCDSLQFDIIFLAVVIDTTNGDIIDIPATNTVFDLSVTKIRGMASSCHLEDLCFW